MFYFKLFAIARILQRTADAFYDFSEFCCRKMGYFLIVSSIFPLVQSLSIIIIIEGLLG